MTEPKSDSVQVPTNPSKRKLETPYLHGFPDLSWDQAGRSPQDISGVDLFDQPDVGDQARATQSTTAQKRQSRPSPLPGTQKSPERAAQRRKTQRSRSPQKPQPPSSQPDPDTPHSLKSSGDRTPSLFTLVWPLIWPVMWSLLLLLSGGLGFVALTRLTQLPEPLSCQNSVTLDSDSARLHCAKQAMQSGDAAQVLGGMKLIEQWQADHPLYGEIQPYLLDSSSLFLTLAHEQIDRGNLTQAVTLAQYIPEASPIYARAQEEIQIWQTEWPQGEAIYAQVQTDIRQQNWPKVAAQIQALGQLSTDYWRQQLSQLRQVIRREKLAESQLKQAQILAQAGDTESLKAAISLAQRVNLQSQTWPLATAEINRWSQSLVKIGLQHRKQGNLTAAISAVEEIPIDSSRFPEVQDLIQFSHAEQAASRTEGFWLPDNHQIFDLLEAKAAVQKITTDSPLHPQAQDYLTRWQAELKDLVQLQYAKVIAGVGDRRTYQLAMDLARLVELDRPRRKQAQTLIAHWQAEIERIEDRPYLIRAAKLAQPATIIAYRAAIAEAQKVALGRGLRIEAQTYVASWTKRIETLEDQPILTQAQTLANQGQLSQAIEVANQIKPGRALRSDAQAAVQEWQQDLQLAQDQPILDQADWYAAQTYLTLAIDTAYQIQPGSPLYGDAQERIAIWENERSWFWEVRGEVPAVDESDDLE